MTPHATSLHCAVDYN